MLITVNWSWIKILEHRRLQYADHKWQMSGVLYAYLDPSTALDPGTAEMLYIGKAVGCTVLQRLEAPDKNGFFADLKRKQRKDAGVVSVMVGMIKPADGSMPIRVTRELIADIESLLINKIKPWGNIQFLRQRNISRLGMRVKCAGDWPLEQNMYVDLKPPLPNPRSPLSSLRRG